MEEKSCCPKFDPAPWQDQMVEWSDKKFIKEKVRTFFFMPLNFGSVMRKLDARVTAAGGSLASELCLSDHTSKWNMDVYLSVDREIPGAENTTLNGKFLTRVYEGPFQDTAKWCADYSTHAREKGLEVKKWYMWYTTCPKCAKKYGKNYTVIVGQVQ